MQGIYHIQARLIDLAWSLLFNVLCRSSYCYILCVVENFPYSMCPENFIFLDILFSFSWYIIAHVLSTLLMLLDPLWESAGKGFKHLLSECFDSCTFIYTQSVSLSSCLSLSLLLYVCLCHTFPHSLCFSLSLSHLHFPFSVPPLSIFVSFSFSASLCVCVSVIWVTFFFHLFFSFFLCLSI